MSNLASTQVIVVGGGIIGLAAALGLQERGKKVTLYEQDRYPEAKGARNITQGAAGQFLPFAFSNMAPEDAARVYGFAEVSRPVYEQLATMPEHTGIVKLPNVELFNEATAWPMELAELMKARPSLLTKAVTLTGSDGRPQTYDSFYEFKTFSIDPGKLLRYLREVFTRQGGEIITAFVSMDMLAAFDVPTIVAPGVEALWMTGDRGLEPVKGITVGFKTERPVPLIAISVDDLLFMPRLGGRQFAVGALCLDNPGSFVAEEAEVKELTERIMELVACQAGPFSPIGPEAFTNPVSFRAGQRVVSKSGPVTRRDEILNHVVWAYGAGSYGLSTAFGWAKELADIVCNM